MATVRIREEVPCVMVPSDMRDTILVIPAGYRPHYLRDCLNSWGEARGFSDLRGVTVRMMRTNQDVEGMTREAAEAAAGRHGFKLQVVMDDPEDGQIKGPDRALGKQINASFEDPNCGFVIECDEDVLVSDDILEYFAWSRSLNPAAVCAHNDLGQGWSNVADNEEHADQAAVQLRDEFTSWCFGFTRAAWQDIWLPSWDWDRAAGPSPEQHGFEWQMHRQANGGLALAVPDASRCQNIGEHGGTFALPHHFASSQAKSFRQHRDPVSYRLR